MLAALLAGLLLPLLGCHTVARVTNLGAPECQEDLRHSLATILILQGEEQEDAKALALEHVAALSSGAPGAQPHGASRSQTGYSLDFNLRERRCYLRVYGRGAGRERRVDRFRFLERRELRACECSP